MNDKELEDMRSRLAREVMGWYETRELGIGNALGPIHYFHNNFFVTDKDDWEPDQNIEQAFMIAKHLSKKSGWVFRVGFDEYGKWSAEFIFFNPIGEIPETVECASFCKTPEEAIFNAAYKTLEVKDD